MGMTTEVTLREWSRDDLAAMAEVINARVAEEGEGEYATAVSMAEQYDHLQRCDPARDIIVAEEAGGKVVGYARAFWGDVAEGYRAYWVALEALGTYEGLLERLLAWGIDRAGAVAAEHEHPDKRVVVWANAGGARQATIEDSDFTPYAWAAYMVRPDLLDIPDRPLPAGLEIRPVEPAQLRAIWEADIEAFRKDRDFVEQTETDWERFRDEAANGTELWQIAWDADGVAGQVRTYVTDGEAELLGRRRAWTENISTRLDWRGKGVASSLIAASLRQLAALDFDEAALGVDLDNPNDALGVYERMGYAVVLRQAQYSKPI